MPATPLVINVATVGTVIAFFSCCCCRCSAAVEVALAARISSINGLMTFGTPAHKITRRIDNKDETLSML